MKWQNEPYLRLTLKKRKEKKRNSSRTTPHFFALLLAGLQSRNWLSKLIVSSCSSFIISPVRTTHSLEAQRKLSVCIKIILTSPQVAAPIFMSSTDRQSIEMLTTLTGRCCAKSASAMISENCSGESSIHKNPFGRDQDQLRWVISREFYF